MWSNLCYGREHAKIVEYLLNAKAPVDALDGNRNSPMHICAEKGHSNILSVLLETGNADVKLKNGRGYTAQEIARRANFLDIVQWFNRVAEARPPGAPVLTSISVGNTSATLEWTDAPRYGVPVSSYELWYRTVVPTRTTTKVSGWMSLDITVPEKTYSIQEGLDEGQIYEFQVQAHSVRGTGELSDILRVQTESRSEYALRLCKYCDSPAEKKVDFRIDLMIREHNLDVNEMDNSGFGPLHYACKSGNTVMIELLCEKYGAVVDLRNQHGMCPIHLAVLGNHSDAVCSLAKFRASVESQTASKDTSIYLAAHCGYADLCIYLGSELGANLVSKGDSGMTPLHIACVNGHAHVVKKMLQKFQLPGTLRDDHGHTMLYYAILYARCKVLEVLVQFGVDPLEPYGNEKWSCLHILALGNQNTPEQECDIGRMLLSKYNVLIGQMDMSGSTPLHYAVRNTKVRVRVGKCT